MIIKCNIAIVNTYDMYNLFITVLRQYQHGEVYHDTLPSVCHLSMRILLTPTAHYSNTTVTGY